MKSVMCITQRLKNVRLLIAAALLLVSSTSFQEPASLSWCDKLGGPFKTSPGGGKPSYDELCT
jgi:hypothetical protein